MVPDLQMLSMASTITDVGLSSTAVELSRSVANVALEKISSVPDRATVSAIPSAAVGISKSLAFAVAAGTNVATETGTRAITSLFGRFGGVINIASSNVIHVEDTNETKEIINIYPESTKVIAEDTLEIMEDRLKPLQSTRHTLKLDSFYESVLDKRDINSFEISHFADFSSTYLDGDLDTFNLVSRHYRNAIETDDNEEVEWSMLQDILLTITKEDASFGVSLILSELMEKYDKTITIEESVEDVEKKKKSKGDGLEGSDLQEHDGWENDWSDPELSGLSSDEGDIADVTRTISKTVNVAEKFIEDLMKYDLKLKSVGIDLSLYITSLAVLIEDVKINPDIAFNMPLKSAFEIARKYVKMQLEICDTNISDKRASSLFVKAVKFARLYLTPE